MLKKFWSFVILFAWNPYVQLKLNDLWLVSRLYIGFFVKCTLVYGLWGVVAALLLLIWFAWLLLLLIWVFESGVAQSAVGYGCIWFAVAPSSSYTEAAVFLSTLPHFSLPFSSYSSKKRRASALKIPRQVWFPLGFCETTVSWLLQLISLLTTYMDNDIIYFV